MFSEKINVVCNRVSLPLLYVMMSLKRFILNCSTLLVLLLLLFDGISLSSLTQVLGLFLFHVTASCENF